MALATTISTLGSVKENEGPAGPLPLAFAPPLALADESSLGANVLLLSVAFISAVVPSSVVAVPFPTAAAPAPPRLVPAMTIGTAFRYPTEHEPPT